MKKKFLIAAAAIAVCILALVIVLVSVGGNAFEYELLPDGTIKITKYTGKDAVLVVPERLDDHRVTAIGDNAFASLNTLTSVEIPHGVSTIGDSAFTWCEALTTVSIPEGVMEIGDNAFAWCGSLTTITIPQSVTAIGNEAFYHCNSLTVINIPSNIAHIGDSAFSGCDKIVYVLESGSSAELWAILNEINYEYLSVTAVGFRYTLLPDGTAKITGYSGEDAKPAILEQLDDCRVTAIGDHAFYEFTSLREVTVPAGITAIGEDAFAKRTLLNVTRGSYAEEWAISNEHKHEYLSFTSEGIEYIPSLDGTAEIIGCSGKIEEFVIPETLDGYRVTALGREALKYRRDREFTFDGNEYVLLQDGTIAIVGCPVGTKEISIPEQVLGLCVTAIGEWAFENCNNLTSVTIPDSVTSIGEFAFLHCESLTSVTIPDSVTSIGDLAFHQCMSLREVTIPDSVTSIGENLFGYCPHLSKIIISPDHPVFEVIDNVLFDKIEKKLICYPDGLQNKAYSIPQGTRSIGYSAFANCNNLTSVTIPDSVTSIGRAAFVQCMSLREVTIPDSVTSIGDEAFYLCGSLREVTIPDSVTSIGDGAFNSSTLLIVARDSYAEEWAISNGKTYEYLDSGI